MYFITPLNSDENFQQLDISSLPGIMRYASPEVIAMSSSSFFMILCSLPSITLLMIESLLEQGLFFYNNLIISIFRKFWLYSPGSELLEISTTLFWSILHWAVSVIYKKLSPLSTNSNACKTGYHPGAFKIVASNFTIFKRFIEYHWTRDLWIGLSIKKCLRVKTFPGTRKLKMMRIQEKAHMRIYTNISPVLFQSQDGAAEISHWHLSKNNIYLWSLKIQFNISTLFLVT